MLFHSAQRKPQKIEIQMDGANLEFVCNFNYLGINIDSNLTWKLHIQKVYNKVYRTIGIMSKWKQFLPLTILVTIYYSLIFPYLN